MWRQRKNEMKKTLFVILLGFFISGAKAQYFPFQPVNEISYYSSGDFHDRVMIQDSSIYEGRGCLQIKNIISGQNDYRWTNHNKLRMLLPNKHGHYIYLKDNSFIGVYDTLLHDYVNINTGQLANYYISSIGISPNGNIWAAGNYTIGIYNGSSWQVYPTNNYGNIKVIDDTSAYISGYPFVHFHNGIVDSLFTMPLNTSLRDWDIDSLGNLWIAANNKLIYYHDTTLVFFDSTNTPVGSEKFAKVVVGKNGHVWTCGAYGKLLEYDGTTWSTHSLPGPYIYIDNFNLDSLSHPWVIGGYYSTYPSPQYSNMSIYVWNGSSFNAPVSFPFMPYTNIKAIAPNAIANDDGIFTFNFNYQGFQINQYRGLHEHPEAIDVNCFSVYSHFPTYGDINYGTHSGVYGMYGILAGLDTSVLPSDTVNYIFNDNGSDYICTDNGLLIYNGVFYNTLNTSNSPLPSDKITFATVVQSQPYNKLYIGTDNGIAIYSNNQWTVIDSSDLGLSNFYVTGILPPRDYYYSDTCIYVTTMGSGLIKIYNSSTYEILNTSNGKFQDDSLYYVIPVNLGACGDFVLIGTKENGLAVYDYWINDFEYYNTSNGYPFSQSCAAVDAIYSAGYVLIGTNTGLYWASPCDEIGENNFSENLNVYPNPSSGVFTIAQPSSSQIEIHNIVGELIYKTVTVDEITTIDLSMKAKGIYFIKTTDRNEAVSNKKIIIN